MAKRMLSLVIFALAVLLEFGCAQNCITGIKDGPALPTFPNQFSAEIEANIIHLNLTLHVTEYYDNINNRGRIESYTAFGSNITLVDYNTMEVSNIMTGADGQKSCMAASLAANSSRFARFLFGPQFDNGTAHIIPTTQFLMFGEEFNETHIGIETVRGVPCHRWQSCDVSTGAERNYTIDYYFTQTNWNYNPVMIPFQVVVNGTSPNRNTSDGSIHQVYNVYSFVNFRPGPADDELFRVPPGLPCLGRQTGKSIPPLPPDYYTVLYEHVNPVDKFVVYFRVHYAYSLQLYRFDYDTSFFNSTAQIEDFNEGVQYNINYRYGSCSVQPINATNSVAVATDSDGTFHLEGIKEHFLRQDEYVYTYEGVSQVRDVDTESWISIRDNAVITERINFTGFIQVFQTFNWSIVNGFNSTFNMSVPWKIILDGNFTYQLDNGTVSSFYRRNEYNQLEFQTSEPDYDPFDVSVCFGVNQYTLLRLNLPLPDGTPYTSLDHTLLRARIRQALSQAANVPPTRLGGINMFDRGSNNLAVFVRVLDTPPYSIHPNAIQSSQIVSTLMNKVNSGQVSITLGKVTISPSIRAAPGSCNSCVEESEGLGTGAVAGLSIGMVIIGIIVGVVSTLLTIWLIRKGKSASYQTSPYSKQTDDVVN